MAWSKTEAGRQEIQSRSKLTARAQRTLLLLVDGRRGDAELLAAVQGTTAADFEALAALGLIADAAAAGAGNGAGAGTGAGSGAGDGDVPPGDAAATPATRGPAPSAASFLRSATGAASASAAAPLPAAAPDSYADFTHLLNELISRQLGLRGFALTLAVEKAATLEELRAVAERVIAAIGERRGAAQGDAARRALYGDRRPSS